MNNWQEISQTKYDDYLDHLITGEIKENNFYIEDPFSIFSKIFDDEVFEILLTETNRYYNRFQRDYPNYDALFEKNKEKNFKEMTSNMMKSFVGILLLLGINIRTSLEDHWSLNPFLKSVVSDFISYDVFKLCWRFLHFNDNDRIKSKVEKISYLIDILNIKWNSIYKPSSKLAVDETMVFNRGRNPYLQYNPMKPAKHGTKLWSLADSTNGYMLRVKIYEGRSKIKENSENLSEKVVLELLQDYCNGNHNIYMDSYFSSPSLFLKLLKNGFNAIGMVRLNRKLLSKEIKETMLLRGENNFFENQNLMILQWKDKRQVNLLTTI